MLGRVRAIADGALSLKTNKIKVCELVQAALRIIVRGIVPPCTTNSDEI
jgi:hypothetical protein